MVSGKCEYNRNEPNKIFFNGGFSGITESAIKKNQRPDGNLDYLASGSEIKLQFSVKNPDNNKFINDKSYEINVFDSPKRESAYGIDSSLGAKEELFHSHKCNYPCYDCPGNDRNHCTRCYEGDPADFAPRYIHEGTCKTICPAGTTNSKSNTNGAPRTCKECDDVCATCVQRPTEEEETVDDYKLCVTCKPEYPFFIEED